MALEEHPELSDWLEKIGVGFPDSALKLEHACSFVNRFETNYFHWIVEWCGQIEALEHYQTCTGTLPPILIRKSGPRYLRESLELLGYTDQALVEWDADASPAFVRRLVAPSLPGIRVVQSPRRLKWLRHRFLHGAGVGAESIAPWRRLYIPRKHGGWRYVLNDDEVRQYLCSRGFEIVEAERLEFSDQVRLFSDATIIVGMHGAGLTNVLFAPHATLLELTGTYGGGEFYSVAAGLDNGYAALPCQPEDDNIIVDIDRLENAIFALTNAD